MNLICCLEHFCNEIVNYRQSVKSNFLNLELFLNFEQSDTKWVGFRSSRPEVFLVKGVLKIRSKFTGEHPCRSVISIKLVGDFIEITPRQVCSSVNSLYIFGTPFSKRTSGWLLP